MEHPSEHAPDIFPRRGTSGDNTCSRMICYLCPLLSTEEPFLYRRRFFRITLVSFRSYGLIL